jgi:predicted RND superfamily exporter protein
MAAAMPVALAELRGVTFDNRVETWLPAHDPHRVVLNWFYGRFGDDSTLLVSWEGSSLNDPRVEAFAAELAGPPDAQGTRTHPKTGLNEIRTPRDLIRIMLDNGVERDTAVRELEGVLVGIGRLKVRLTSNGRARQDDVVEEIRQKARAELGLDVEFLSPETPQATASDVEREEDLLGADAFSGPGADDPYPLPARHDFQIRWAGMMPRSPVSDRLIVLCRGLVNDTGQPLVEDCFFAPGAPVAVMVSMSENDDEQIERILMDIRQAAERVGIPVADLHMGGSPYGRSALNHAAGGALWNPEYPGWMLHKRSPVLTSALVGIGLAFVMLRSVKLALLVLLTNLFVVTMTTALLPLSGHAMNMVLIVMPNLVMVLTASGAIHLSNYWVHEAAMGAHGAVERAVRTAFQPSVLSIATTVVGLLSLLTSVLTPVRDFGVYSSIGCVILLVTVLAGFPAMLQFWRGPVPPVVDPDDSQWRRLGEWLYRHSTFVIVASLVAFALGVWGLQWFRTETKVIRYFPHHARVYQDYAFLEQNLSGVAPVEVVVSFAPRLEPVEGDEHTPPVGADVDELPRDGAAGDELPPEEPAPRRLNSVERMELIRKIKVAVAAHPEISGTLALSDFRPPLDTPADDAPPLVKIRFNRTVYEMDKFLKEAQHEGHHGLVAVAESPLHTRFGEQSVAIPQGAELWRIRAQVAMMTDLDYSRLTADVDRIVSEALQGVPGTTHVVTGMTPVFLRTQEAVVESLVNSFGLAFLVMVGVMMLLLGHPLAGLITMWPSLLPVIVVFGMISWAGIPVDIGTMITASVGLGIADDERLHELTWFRNGLRQGLSRQDAVCLGLAHCGAAMTETGAVIGFSMLMLAWTDLLLVSRFGWLMAALIGASLASDILVTPALLAGPLGALLERANRKRTAPRPHIAAPQKQPDPSTQ